MKVLVVQYFSADWMEESFSGDYFKWLDLPSVPLPGMGIIARQGLDPTPIIESYFNEKGTPVCRLEHWIEKLAEHCCCDTFTGFQDCDFANEQEARAYMESWVKGWTKAHSFNFYTM